MILPKQCDRLAAFYRVYELNRYGRRRSFGYNTTTAIKWGEEMGVQPVPGPEASQPEIEAWERRLADVLAGVKK